MPPLTPSVAAAVATMSESVLGLELDGSLEWLAMISPLPHVFVPVASPLELMVATVGAFEVH